MSKSIESIMSELPENDNACVFSLDIGADLVWIILNVTAYKSGAYNVLNFDSLVGKPKDMYFYMHDDEIIAFSSHGVKEALRELSVSNGIPEQLFNEIFGFMERKSPLSIILRNPYFIEIFRNQIQKVLDLSILIEEKQRQINEFESILINWGVIAKQEN